MIQIGLEGLYRIEAFKRDEQGLEVPGSRRVAADWFPNLILDAGLEYMGSNSNWLQYCRVGTGSTPPNASQTALVSLVGSTNSTTSSVTGAQSSAPYFGWRRNTYRFAEGVATGNLAEVGVGWGASGLLFSRALILDSGGSPTTIQVLADEALDVIYELRFYPPTEDATGSITLDGASHSWTSRASRVTEATPWSGGQQGMIVSPVTGPQAFTGAIGAITGTPSGTATTIAATRATYVANSKKSKITLSANLTQGNLVGGIRSVGVSGNSANFGSYQIEFDPPIPKVNTKVLTLDIEIGWSRRTT